MLEFFHIINQITDFLFSSGFLAIGIILLIGLIITVEDFKSGKIRNKWIMLGLYLGSLYYLLLIIFTILGSLKILNVGHFQPQYYLYILAYTAIAFILSFTLWHFKLWAGGDAKLFTLYVFLIPLTYYANAYFKYFPQFNLLINIFVPIFIYLVIKMLLYPLQLGFNYLRNPQLLQEYIGKYTSKYKINKTQIKKYVNIALSFLLIMIFFQILRNRVGEFIDPYLGQMVAFAYFFMGYVLFQPLRALLQKRVILVSILISLYFILGYIFFRDLVYKDLHKIFALQILIMCTYFYIFKFGREAGRFLYNSAEVRMIPLQQIQGGIYINKDYIRKMMGDRTDLNVLRKELGQVLEKDDQEKLMNLIRKKTDKIQKEKQQYQLLMRLRNLNIQAIPNMVKDIYAYKKDRLLEKAVMEKVSPKLNDKQKEVLDNIMHNTDDVKKFLKTISGKLTEDQAQKLKEMIETRNDEVVAHGQPPIKHIILHKTFSFAPFMLLGVIITLATKSSLIHLLYQYILRR